MIAAVIVGAQLALAINRSPELAAPNHQCVLQQTALLQVLYQSCTGLIGVLRLPSDLLRQFIVLIPTAVEELDESYSALGETPG